jgi:hypothetical protein
MVPGAMLACALALASCGPDSSANGPSASTNVAAASTGPAAASAASLAASPSTLAPACPKVEAPKCPGAGPAARGTATASLASPNLASSSRPATHLSTAWSGGVRRSGRHAHLSGRGGAYADRERRDWDLGRPWPGDRPRGGRRDYDGQGLTHGDRLANERDRHDGLLGGPGDRAGGWGGEGRDFAARGSDHSVQGGYRILQQESRGFASQSSHFDAGERMVEHYREEGQGAFGPCPRDCRDQAYRRFSYAGVDERGYLVWPGKVEY